MRTKFYLAAATTAVVVSVYGTAFAQTAATPVQADTQCVPARQVWSHSNWRQKHPETGVLVCSDPGAAAIHREFRIYQQYRRLAKIPGFHEGDPYLEWLPIPRYIVACETNGSHGRARWTAHNSSGAQGPAQLLGWPAPENAHTPAQKLAYWREVVRGPLQHQGLSAWSCA